MPQSQNLLGGSIKEKRVNQDLEEERQKCIFDKKELQVLCWGEEHIKFFRRCEADKIKYPELNNTHKFYEMSREEQQREWWRRHFLVYKIDKQFYVNGAKPGSVNWFYFYEGVSPVTLHYTMFYQTILALGTDEQKTKYVDKIQNMNIIGAYAQTELGHGSDVSSLMTTATLDMETDEFVLHTPSIKAAKFWPGVLGRFANHAIVFARVIVNDEDYGVQAIVVQIRSFEEHLPLPGIKVGDLGSKFGYQSKDNGWMMFDHYRVPRDALLSRIAGVDKEGSFEIKGDLRLLYSIMLFTRQMIIYGASAALQKALLIATRYAVCRRQFRSIAGSKEERKLLDYQTHMFKLGPQLCNSFAIGATARYLEIMNERLNQELKENNFKLLDQLHHWTSGLKSLFTEMTYNGIDIIRQSCGGAGFHVWSGLPQIFFDWSPNVTLEGDNTVMAQQNSRYLFKQVRKAQEKQSCKGVFEYINHLDKLCQEKSTAKSVEEFISIDHLRTALAARSAFSIKTVKKMIDESEAPSKTKTNELFARDIITMSQHHMLFLTFQVSCWNLDESKVKDAGLRKVLTLLYQGFAVSLLDQDSANLYESGFFGAGSRALLQESFKYLMNELRPHMIPLVEYMNWDPAMTMSSIGNHYGDIYETTMEWAMDSKLNQTPRPYFYKEFMQPIIHGKM